MAMQKPKYCGQSWLDMEPTTDGRLCSGCHKNIMDFSKKNFKEIEKIQSANDNSICGMYSNKQLKNWGQDNSQNKFSKKLVVAASSIIVATSQIKASDNLQTTSVNHYLSELVTSSESDIVPDSTEKVVEINGFVFETDSAGEKTAITFANVWLKSNNIGTTTDEEGNFKIQVPKSDLKELKDTIIISFIGYGKKELIIDYLQDEKITLNIELKEAYDISVFYVSQPSLVKRMTWKIKNLFRSKK